MKRPTKLDEARAKLVEASATLSRLQKQHGPALAAQEAALAAAIKAKEHYAKECSQRGAAHLKSVGYTHAKALRHVLAALGCTQADVDAQELMSSSYLSPDTDVMRAVHAIESTLRRAALVPEDVERLRQLEAARADAYAKANYESVEQAAIRSAAGVVLRLENEVAERERQTERTEVTKTKKAKTEPRLVKARKMLREGFPINAFGVTTKVVGHGK